MQRLVFQFDLLFGRSRNINIERSSLMQFAGSSDDAVVVVNYFLDNREADAGAGVFIFAMELLEYFKYFCTEFFFKTNAIVRNGDMAVIFCR